MKLVLDAYALERLLNAAFPSAKGDWLKVEELQPGRARIRMPFRPSMLRPGNSVSGPALFVAADTAMYVCVMAHIGPAVMAVTSQLNLNFLAKGTPGDIHAEARLLRLGKRTAVMEVALRTGDSDELVAHATGSYALPSPSVSKKES